MLCRIAVIRTGGIGAYLGRLAAVGGVVFITHLEALDPD